MITTVICFSQTNTNISNSTNWDTEPYIAVNPTNSNNIVAAWMRVSGITLVIGTNYSIDGGLTWTTPTTIPNLHPTFLMADVSLTFNNAGNVFMSYVNYSAAQDSGYVMVTKSLDGGATWGARVKAFNGLATPDKPIDRPWIVVDNSGGVFDGRLYVVTKSVESGVMPHHVWMKYSADNGSTWSSQILVDDSIPSNLITNTMGAPTVGADGSLYIGYLSYDPPSSPFARMICLKSTDGGVSFIPHIIGYPVAGSAITDTLYQGSIVLSANPTVAGNIVFTFTDQRNGDPDILSVHSNDGGNTWTSVPVRLNDDGLSNGVGQDMSWAGFSTTGKYGVAWRDRRNTGGTSSSPFEIFSTVSIDGGSTFKPNYKISSAPSPFINIQKGNDFIGISLNDNFVFYDWCDLRTGNTEIFFNKTSMTFFTAVSEGNMPGFVSSIFPNPTSTNATLKFTVKEKQFLNISLFDLQGRLMKIIASQNFNIGDHTFQISTSDLPSGTYLVCMKNKNETVISSVRLTVGK